MLKCGGCNRDLKAGDLYIRDTPSGFIDEEPILDDLIAEILGGSNGEVVFCERCTIPGGKYQFEVAS